MKTNNFTLKAVSGKILLLALSLLISGGISSQCNSNFTSTVTNATAQFQGTSVMPTNHHYWNFGDGSTAYSTINPSHTYNAVGIYTVTHMVMDSSTWCSTSSTGTVSINHVPCNTAVNFSVHKDSTQALSWLVYPSYPGNTILAIWSWGDGSTSSSLYPSHTYSAAGAYNICVQVYTSCGDTGYYCVSANVYRTSHVSENASMVNVNVVNHATAIKSNGNTTITEAVLYPNPSKDNTVLNISSTVSSAYRMTIYSSDGKLLMSETINAVPGTTTSELKTAQLQTGLYFISLTNGKDHKTLKLIKE